MTYGKGSRIDNTIMWFEKPAEGWLQALPLGNGHIGCMIYNDPFCDTLSLNDDTLWSGYEHHYCKKDFAAHMAQVRELMKQGKRTEAEEIVESHLTNRFTQAYMPFGDIMIESNAGKVEAYRRELDMGKGIVSARYVKNGIRIQTQTFVSCPDDVLIHIIESEEPEDYKLSFKSRLLHEVDFDMEGFTIKGCAPSDIRIGDVGNFYSDENSVSYDETEKSTKICARAQVISDGRAAAYPEHLSVAGAKRILIVYSSATSFEKGTTYKAYSIAAVMSASKKDIFVIRNTHIHDHASLFERMHIDLGFDDASCEERCSRMRKGNITNSDISLLFHYGRYLLIASSRKGTQAANLQGIWNKDLIPPWWSGYTLNINLQMNYWLADRTNLAGCFDPLVNYVKRLWEAGKRTAAGDYGTEGSVAHHQSDIWAHSTPVGFDICKIPQSARYIMWNMALPWLCVQLFDHYLYTLDEEFLKTELLPIMKDAATFIMSSFMEIDGRLYNIPSTSPENMYVNEDGHETAICNMSAMDIGICREFFTAYTVACSKTDEDAEAERCSEFARKIADYAVSAAGELLEWDREYAETEPGHRHFSMLFGVYPGSHLLNGYYADAAKKSLMKRLQNGSGQTGWSAVWAIALLTRFGEGEAAYNIITKLLGENIHENMFGAHPPDLFQIDANFGFTAAICELILQEYGGVIKLLPAIPKAMQAGSIHGLKIHSGHVISLAWKYSRVTVMEICAARDDEILVDAGYLASDDADYAGCAEGIRIALKQGRRYVFQSKV